MANSILPDNDKPKAKGRVRSLWVDDDLWSEIQLLAKKTGHSTSRAVTLLLRAAVIAYRKEQASLAAESTDKR